MIKKTIAREETIYLRLLASRKLHVKEQLCDVTNKIGLKIQWKLQRCSQFRKYSSSISIGIYALNDGFIITTIQYIAYRSTFIYILGSKNNDQFDRQKHGMWVILGDWE